ncbi:cupin domain-containing protein [Phenylobacterium sp. LjRoot225]|uniref:cupin domain-containing protein n=1 Tax=Phenylobacterium sp. LjRoot225 TaxID=3342285 RepID=UPI003ECE7D27
MAGQDVISIGCLEIRYLRDGAADGAAGMFELTVPPGATSPPAHSHASEEMLYCLEGVLRTTVGDEVRDLAPGQSGYTLPGVVHGFSNPHDRPARVLVINTPDIGAQYFLDIAAAVAGPDGPDPARVVEVMRRYGLTIAPPRGSTS